VLAVLLVAIAFGPPTASVTCCTAGVSTSTATPPSRRLCSRRWPRRHLRSRYRTLAADDPVLAADHGVGRCDRPGVRRWWTTEPHHGLRRGAAAVRRLSPGEAAWGGREQAAAGLASQASMSQQ